MDTPLLVAVIALVVVALVAAFLFWRRSSATEDTDVAVAPPRSALGSAIRRALGSGLDEGTWESIEAALLAGDVGVEATDDIVTAVRESRPEDPDQARTAIRVALRSALVDANRNIELTGSPASIVVVGVNGTGKTTTIAKLAKRLMEEGKTVTLAAADTFRAAAPEQLQTWGDRVGAKVVRGQEGGDPAAVAFDALESARAKGVDVVIIDTAGRLHGKKNLMAELKKIHRVAGGDQVSEVLLVLDATAGQNGLAQVREFTAAIPITGIVLSKLDGTARGGIVIAVERSLGVPVKLVGVGEGLDDLVEFDPNDFVDSLME
ncbi:MAG TPA: signal recognition particle-docking protein FtsY [Acidimicrobiia bacterium]|nr:signal recognition particle-docking protein FtsY [Acidimicrobiia bacterium]